MDHIGERIEAYRLVPPDAKGEAHGKHRIIEDLGANLGDGRVLTFFLDLIGDPNEYDLARLEALKLLGLWEAPSRQSHERIGGRIAALLRAEEDVLVQQWAAIAARNYIDVPAVFSAATALLCDRKADLDVRHNCLTAIGGKGTTAAAIEVLRPLSGDRHLGPVVRRMLEELEQ